MNLPNNLKKFLATLDCRFDSIQSGFGIIEDSLQITEIKTGTTFNIFLSEYNKRKVKERVREIRREFNK